MVLQYAIDDDKALTDALTIKVTDVLWRQILVGEKSAAWALAQGTITVESGSVAQFASMMGIFES